MDEREKEENHVLSKMKKKKVVWIKVSTSAQKMHLSFVHICSESEGGKKKSISGKTFSFQSAFWMDGSRVESTAMAFDLKGQKSLRKKNKSLNIKFQSRTMSFKLNHFPFDPISSSTPFYVCLL